MNKQNSATYWLRFSPVLPLMCLLFPALAWAQQAPLRFQQVSRKEGLSQSSVTAIVKDRQGFMWFGTEAGLNRYDGYEVTVFHHDPSRDHTLGADYINALAIDGGGDLWISAGDSLNRFERTTHHFQRFQVLEDSSRLGNREIGPLFADRQGGLWMVTSSGVFRRDPAGGQVSRMVAPVSEEIQPNWAAITQSPRDAHRIWVIFQGSLYQRDGIGSAMNPVKATSLEPFAGSFNRLWCDDAGDVWLTAHHQLIHFNWRADKATVFLPDPTTRSEIRAMVADDEGRLWLGGDGGLFAFDRADQRFTFHGDALGNARTGAAPAVLSLAFDPEGILWVGTEGDGVFYADLNAAAFASYSMGNGEAGGLASNMVRTFFEDRQGTLWIGTDAGLNQFDPDNRVVTQPRAANQSNSGWMTNRIRDLVEDQHGNVWLATDKGLVIWDQVQGNSRVLQHDRGNPQSLPSNDVRSLLADKQGTIWIGTNGRGLGRYEPDRDAFVRFDEAGNDQFLGRFVNFIHQDHAGHIWVGTSSGLHLWHPQTQRFKHYLPDTSEKHAISHRMLVSVHEQTEALWFGTFGGGLNRFDPASGRFTSYGEQDGLPSHNVVGISSDQSGRLWLSTTNGLAVLDVATGTVRSYSAEAGIPANEFNSGAYYRDSRGWLYFGGTQGFSTFDPVDVTANRHPPRVVLTDFLVFDQSANPGYRNDPDRPFVLPLPIDQTDTVYLSHREPMFTLEFVGLHYADPSQHRYAFRLEGYDRQWRQAHAGARRVTYSKLPAGDYTFHVNASNKDGVWAERDTRLRIVIAPPPCRTGWAYALYILFVAGLVGIYIRNDRRKLEQERLVVQRLQRIDRLKDTFLAATSHELRTPLYGMIGLAESLRDRYGDELPVAGRDTLDTITACGQRLSTLIGDVLTYSQLRSEHIVLRKRAINLHAVTATVLTLTRPLIGTKALELRNDISPDGPLVCADENRMLQTLHNLVGNAVKFSISGTISVDADWQPDMVWIRVTDQGIGIPDHLHERLFEPYAQADPQVGETNGGLGLGLWISKQLVTLHGGEITVTAHEGGGTRFSFSLPRGPEPETHAGDQDSAGRPAIADALMRPAMTALSSSPVIDASVESPNRFHLLVVDDDQVSRHVISVQLKQSGYQVSQADSGQRALDLLLGDHQIDLVVLDIMMPGLTGYDVCRKLRDTYAADQLPILFLTARDRLHDLMEGYRVGGNDFLSKPVAMGKLLARVKLQIELLESRRGLERQVAARTEDLAEKTRRLQEQAFRLVAKDEWQTKFFTNLSHELRTPLTLILAPLEELNSAKDMPATLAEQVALMHRNAQSLIAAVDQMLDVTELTSDQASFQPIQTTPTPFLERWLQAFRELAQQLGVRLDGQLNPGQVLLTFDPEKFERIVAILLANALRRSPPGSVVNVSLTMPQPTHVQLSVHDQGTNRPTHLPDQEGDTWFPSSDYRGSSSANTLIGLTLARELAELHGGDLSAETLADSGTQVTLRLPTQGSLDALDECELPLEIPCRVVAKTVRTLSLELAELLPVTPLPTSRGRKDSRILIISGNLDLCRYLGRLLAAYQPLLTGNGGDGLQLAFDHSPDLILCDLNMAGMDGLDVCRLLKQDERTNHIPLLVLTARITEELKFAGLASGVEGFLEKPFAVKELRARVQNILAGRDQFRQRVIREETWQPTPLDASPADTAFVEKAIEIIETHSPNADFGVLELAAEMGFSRRQLLRKIRTLTGKTPTDLIRWVRIHRAAKLLEARAGTISEIAYRAGFKNVSHFSDLFHTTFGKAPKDYVNE